MQVVPHAPHAGGASRHPQRATHPPSLTPSPALPTTPLRKARRPLRTPQHSVVIFTDAAAVPKAMALNGQLVLGGAVNVIAAMQLSAGEGAAGAAAAPPSEEQQTAAQQMIGQHLAKVHAHLRAALHLPAPACLPACLHACMHMPAPACLRRLPPSPACPPLPPHPLRRELFSLVNLSLP